MIYAMIGMAIVMALSLGYAKLEHSSKVEAQAKEEACNTKIDAQNVAIAALAADAAKKQAAGAQALKAAEGKAKVWTDNAVRLQAALTARKPDGPKDCKAAWQEIRK